MDHKDKSSVINRIKILENQVTDLHQKFDKLDHKFDLLPSMLTPLITTHSVVCTPSQATDINVEDSQVNNLPPAASCADSCDIPYSCSQVRDAHIDQAHCTRPWTSTNSQLIKEPPDSKPIKPSASMIIKTSNPRSRSQSYEPPTKVSDHQSDPKLRAYKPLQSQHANYSPRDRQGSGGEVSSYVKILDPLRDQPEEGCLELSDEIPRRC